MIFLYNYVGDFMVDLLNKLSLLKISIDVEIAIVVFVIIILLFTILILSIIKKAGK